MDALGSYLLLNKLKIIRVCNWMILLFEQKLPPWICVKNLWTNRFGGDITILPPEIWKLPNMALMRPYHHCWPRCGVDHTKHYILYFSPSLPAVQVVFIIQHCSNQNHTTQYTPYTYHHYWPRCSAEKPQLGPWHLAKPAAAASWKSQTATFSQ